MVLIRRQHLETDMGEVVRFISKSDRERLRLTREARAIYDSVFRPADPADEQQDVAPISRANPFCSDEVLS
jgi:hypothetical protein